MQKVSKLYARTFIYLLNSSKRKVILQNVSRLNSCIKSLVILSLVIMMIMVILDESFN